MLLYVNAYHEAHALGPKPKRAETFGDLGSPPGLQAYLSLKLLQHRNGRPLLSFSIDILRLHTRTRKACQDFLRMQTML